jgi:enterochelin esterase-like enzyme
MVVRGSSSPAGAVSGELVTEGFPYDGGRSVTVYVPPYPPEAIVFAGEGQVLAQWGADLEGTDLPSTMVVGVHRSVDEDVRLHEYSPGFDADRFEAHEAFVVDEVRRWVAGRFGVALPPERTAALGVSAGGELALALAVRHPQLFGAVLCASPGAGYRPPVDLQHPLPRAYFVAGNQEPFFRENASRWAGAWRAVGAEVVLKERVGAHGDPFWRQELPKMVAWAFGP